MKIRYPTRSSFLEKCLKSIDENKEKLLDGLPVYIHLSPQGYDDKIDITIDSSKTETFIAEWESSDPTRFPARIRAAAFALFKLNLSGKYQISHEKGKITVLQIEQTSLNDNAENNRICNIKRFFSLLDEIENLTGKKYLAKSSGKDGWPQRGVYFFFDTTEERKQSGHGLRVTRIGTHGLKSGSKTTLWKRLSQHRGTKESGSGNHRTSIFRLLVGTAIIKKENLSYPSWGNGSSAERETIESEKNLEIQVSKIIGQFPFLYLAIEDKPGRQSLRGYIERNSIALLSNSNKAPIDSPSKSWLGNFCPKIKVQESGLWNQNHVDERYDPDFLNVMEDLIKEMKD